MEDQVIGGIDSRMQRAADDLLEDEVDLRASDQDTISVSSSNASSTVPMMQVGMETEVIFEGDQLEGEEKAREYTIASVNFSVLKEEMEAMDPMDPGYQKLQDEIEVNKSFLRVCIKTPIIQEFIRLLKQKKIREET